MACRYKEIRCEIVLLARKKNFAGVLQALVNHLRFLQAKHDLAKVSRYIKYLAPIYDKGNKYVQYLIENLFVRSFGSLRNHSGREEWAILYAQLPTRFAAIYEQQINEK